MTNSRKIVVLMASIVMSFAGNSFAKVSQDQANRLGNDLTPMGAEKAGNAAGTIPAYTGKIVGAPSWVNYKGTGTHYPELYPNEKPLFYISATNVNNYHENLTPGLQAVLQRNAESFKLPVYASHRDTSFNDVYHKHIRANATNAELVDGVGIVGAYAGVPFPLPENGAELIWNHLTSLRHWSYEAVYMQAAVYPTGDIAINKYRDILRSPYYDPNGSAEAVAKEDLLGYFVKYTLEPARQKGEIVLVHEFLNQGVHPRAAWAYIPGSRRVRRAPTVGYDNPSGAGGLRTDDERVGFNGAIDRYEWKLMGKREIFIPYHNYKFENNKLKYADIMQGKHPDADLFRFELHRVWVLEATLKASARHIYAKRMFYIDEDSWITHLAENYDAKGNLWRAQIINSTYSYDLPGITSRVEVLFDLQNGSYVIDKLYNEEPHALTALDKPYDDNYFTPGNLRKLGSR